MANRALTPVVALKDVVLPTSLWNPKYHKKSIKYIDVSSVSRDTARIESTADHDELTAPSRARKLVGTDDTIFATIRPSLRRIAKVNGELDGQVASTAFCVLRPNREVIEPDFLFYAVRTDDFINGITRLETGAGYPAVRDRDVLDQRIPLPDLHQQRKISQTLKLAEEAVLYCSRFIAVASDLKSAVMKTLFTCGPRGETQKESEIGLIPKSWKMATIGEHFDVVSGGTPSRSVSAYWKGGTIPWVKTAEVDYRLITDTEERITDIALVESAAKLLPAGTLLMAMYGQGVTRGKVAILGIDAACNQACAAMLPLDDKVLTRYLFHFLAYRYEEIRRLSHGGQQQNLNLDIVRDLHLAMPASETEQQEIARILDAIDASVQLHERKRAVLEEIFKSLLNGLMSGEIDVNVLDLSVLQRSA